jgi:hypothetical protein
MQAVMQQCNCACFVVIMPLQRDLTEISMRDTLHARTRATGTNCVWLMLLHDLQEKRNVEALKSSPYVNPGSKRTPHAQQQAPASYIISPYRCALAPHPLLLLPLCCGNQMLWLSCKQSLLPCDHAWLQHLTMLRAVSIQLHICIKQRNAIGGTATLLGAQQHHLSASSIHTGCAQHNCAKPVQLGQPS